MIDLRRLRVLRAVAHHGTVTAAAESLYLTPSAASQQMRQLGRELGVILLEPHGRRVRLTPAARGLLAHAEAIEERWQRAEAELVASAPGDAIAGELRLCAGPTAISTLLAPAAAQLTQQHPRLTVTIREAEPPDCLDLLFSGAADLAITMAAPNSPPLTDARFEQHRLLEDPYDLLTTPGHPLATRAEVTLADCATEPWILSMPGTTYRQMILNVCNAAGFTPHIAHEALEWTAVATLVSYGLGITLVHRLTQIPAQLAVVRTRLDPNSSPNRQLFTMTRRGSADSPNIATTRSLLQEIAIRRCRE